MLSKSHTKQSNLMQCNAKLCYGMQCNVINCNVMLYNAMSNYPLQCNPKLWNATQSKAIQSNPMLYTCIKPCKVLQWSTMDCEGDVPEESVGRRRRRWWPSAGPPLDATSVTSPAVCTEASQSATSDTPASFSTRNTTTQYHSHTDYYY